MIERENGGRRAERENNGRRASGWGGTAAAGERMRWTEALVEEMDVVAAGERRTYCEQGSSLDGDEIRRDEKETREGAMHRKNARFESTRDAV